MTIKLIISNTMKPAATKPPTFIELLRATDPIQARRYEKLNKSAQDIAREGILRHLRACQKLDVKPEPSTCREIIDDAQNGNAIFR